MRTFLGGLVIGGLIGYFLDPRSGSQRRGKATGAARKVSGSAGGVTNKVSQAASSAAHTAESAMQSASSTVGSAASDATDVVREKVSSVRGADALRDNPDPDDKTLADRVESEVFRDDRVPKGKININVAKGIVEVRGQLDSQADIDYVMKCVRAVPDVATVHNYLHLPGTPAPNKEEAIRASR